MVRLLLVKKRVMSSFNASRARRICRIIETDSISHFETPWSHGNGSEARKLVPNELKPRDVERRFFSCEQLLQRQNRKGFLHSTSTARPNIHGAKVILCIWWDHLGVVYYELLKPNETITGDQYWTQLMRLNRALQTLLLPNTICFDWWQTAWLIIISALTEKSKNGSIRGSPQKTYRFFEMVSDNYQKVDSTLNHK